MKKYIVTYIEKVYYKPVFIDAESKEQAKELFETEHLGDLDVADVEKVTFKAEEV